jgi:hypothetical protein
MSASSSTVDLLDLGESSYLRRRPTDLHHASPPDHAVFLSTSDPGAACVPVLRIAPATVVISRPLEIGAHRIVPFRQNMRPTRGR